MHRRRIVLALFAASTSALPKDFFTAGGSDNDVCPSKGMVACSAAALPSGFCCPAESQCQALAGGTTALCCPKGSSCDRIQPIACDVRLQDPKDHPNATVITSVFDVNLDTCDNGCCPFGYSCAAKIAATGKEGRSQCVRDEDQSKKPGNDGNDKTTTTTSAPSSTATATSSHETTPASATASPTASGSDGADTEKGMRSRTMSIIGGVVGGSLVLLIIVIVAILYLRRRKRTSTAAQQYEKSTGYRTGTSSSSSSSSSHHARGLQISEPIVQQDSYRTDFMLKSPSAMSSISNQPVNSRWSGSTNAAAGGAASRTRNLTPSAALRRAAQRHLSIPNPFSSPNPSTTSARRESVASSYDESQAKTGHVARLAPIRSMRSSKRVSRRTEPQHVRKEASEESINVFADANAVPPLRQQQQQQGGRDVHDDGHRMTTFSDLMDNADLGGVHRGTQRYVPGTTPRL